MIIHLIAGLIKKIECDSIVYKMSQYFATPDEPFGGHKVDLSNYATKTDIKDISCADT